MKIAFRSLYLLCVVSWSGSCSNWFGGEKIKPQEPVEQGRQDAPAVGEKVAPPVEVLAPAAAQKTDDEVYLKQARLDARMDEIESELKRQREKIRLLEQGLLTGIAPDELKSEKTVTRGAPGHKLKMVDKHSSVATLPKPDLHDIGVTLSPSNTDKLETSNTGSNDTALASKIQGIKDHYQASRFGVAISELAAVSREFGENAGEGIVRIWLGKSYLGLKEYTTARVEFEAYLKAWPSGEHVAQARLDLAKSYVGLGLKERARGELRRVMNDFDGQEPSEIAAVEFKKLQGGL